VTPQSRTALTLERRNCCFSTSEHGRLIFGKFKKGIALRLRVHSAENAHVFVVCSLARDIEDYRITPHPDGWLGILTSQFYLPVDMSQQDLGTSIYAEVPLLRRLSLGRYQEIKRVPFVPNSGYAFAVKDLPGHRSLHGRELIRAGAGVCVGAVKTEINGGPDAKHISTSFVVRSNLTMRMSMRRFTRPANALSKKFESHCHALASFGTTSVA
jgi:hypothetical protein